MIVNNMLQARLMGNPKIEGLLKKYNFEEENHHQP
jgi:hypothetical protein